MSPTAKIVDPAEFVQSFTATKYKEGIEVWRDAETPADLIFALRTLKAPKAAYAEISAALAEEVLPAFEKKYPCDLRPRKAVEAAKAWIKNRTAANARAAEEASNDAWHAADYATDATLMMVANDGAADAASAAYNAAAVASAAYPIFNACHVEGDYTIYAIYGTVDAAKTGIPNQRILDTIKEVGYRYFSFLKPS